MILLTLPGLLSDPVPTAAAGNKYTYFSDTEYRGSSGGTSYGLATGVVVCEQKALRPIAWFGAVKPADGASQLLYLLLFKTAADYHSGFGLSTNSHGSSDTGAEGTTIARVGKKKVEVVYQFATDPRTHAVQKQSLRIGGREVKGGDSRVFVVDVTGESVTCTPVKVELPKEVPDISQGKREEWDAVIDRAIEQLRKDSPELAKLLGT
jgi:hypothetical protein